MYRWELEPSLLLGLIGQTAAYLLCIGPLRHLFPGSAPATRKEITCFLLGSLAMVVALVSPISTLGEGYLLSMHMVQHLLITAVAPPLFLLGTPRWLLRPLVQTRPTLAIGRFLTSPLVAFLLFNIVFVGWHVPQFYEAALKNQYVHILEHVTFFATATLTWWPVLSPLDELPAANPGVQVLYLFFEAVPPTILGAIITFSGNILYPTYARSPLIWGLSHQTDQELAGLIMWMIGGLIFFGVLTVVFFRWFNQDEYEEGRDFQQPRAILH